jgi:hypothetical protein
MTEAEDPRRNVDRMLKLLPNEAVSTKDILWLARVVDLIDTEEPTIAKLNTETAEPMRPKLRKDNAEPNLANSSTEIIPPARTPSNNEAAEPMRDNDRSERELPIWPKLRTDSVLPARANERILNEEPIFTSDKMLMRPFWQKFP